MALPWVRLDSNVASHDKILRLLSDPSPKRFQAAASYMFSLAWSGGTGTDGHIPSAALPFVHGTPATARLLVKYQLWDEATAGFTIRNFLYRQELAIVAEAKRTAQRLGAAKGNCIRHHGSECRCWEALLGTESVSEIGNRVGKRLAEATRATGSHGRTEPDGT
jgi:hypothetical protein